MLYRIFFAFTVLCLAVSCRSIKPDAPSLSAEAFAVPVPPPSQIDIPVQVDLQPVYTQIEKSVPLKLNSAGYPGWQQDANCLLHYRWNFWREKLTFTALNNTLSIGCIGYYQGEGEARPCCWDWCPYVGAGCGMGEPPRQLQLGISSTINIRPDYRIVATTALTKLLPINRCRVTTLSFDITDNIMQQARAPIEQACRDFDNSMLRYNLRGQVEQVWKMLNTPIPIDTIGVLVFHPSALRISPLTAKGNTLHFSLGATASPQFALNAAELPAAKALPDISTGNGQAQGFFVYLDTRLHYAELSKMVNRQVQGMRFDFGKKYIEVLEVQLAGTGNQKLMIKVNFKGSAKGWMYLTGTPQFDTVTKELTLPDLDFDVKTSNMLLKSAKWLFSNKITGTIRQNARFSVADMMTMIKNQVEQNLNRNLGNGISSSGKVTRLSISSIYPATQFIQVTMLIQGDLDAKLTDVK